MADKKKIFFNVVFFIVIVFTFILVEILLRIAGFGNNTEIFIKKYGNYYLNTNFIKKYYQGEINDNSPKIMFPVKKPENELRCFLIGESTPQGFPYSSNKGFDKMTEVIYNRFSDGKKIKIYNLGYSAMSSYYVRDVAAKLVKYDPDIVLIYAGHNEYYGTFGALSGGSYFGKNFNLWLHEWKLIQAADIFIGLFKHKSKDVTLMERQFGEKIIKKDEFSDEVRESFSKNLDSTVRILQSRKIKTYLVSPVSNLVDMAPFKADFTKSDAELVDYYNSGKITADKLDSFKDKNSIYYRYLYAKVTGKANFDELKAIKDADLIPFRIKSNLADFMRDRYKEIYIDIEESLYKRYGAYIFSNNIFIDHLHFNKRGNFVAASLIAADLLVRNEKKQIDFNDTIPLEEKIYDEINLTSVDDIWAYISINNILSGAPYKDMKIKYIQNVVLRKDEVSTNPELMKVVEGEKGVATAYESIINYYLSEKNFDLARKYNDGIRKILPGSFGGFLYSAKLNLATGRTYGEIEQDLIDACRCARVYDVKSKYLTGFIDDYVRIYNRQKFYKYLKKNGLI